MCNFRFDLHLVKICCCLAVLVVTSSPLCASPPAAEQVAPGIWRIRVGEPEIHTPVKYRTLESNLDALKAMQDAGDLPVDLKQVAVTIASRGCSIELPMASDEKIYGLGVNTTQFDQTNRRNIAAVSDHPENEINTSHAPVPFYVSSKGFGVYVDSARFVSFFTGSINPVSRPAADSGISGAEASGTEDLYRARELRRKTMLIDVPVAQGVDIYVFAGPKMIDCIRRYNLFSGGGCVPPMWGLGMGYRGLNKFTGDESVKLAKTFREQRIPCDMWGLEPGWQTNTYSCSFLWNKEGFPDPDAFVKSMTEMGYRLNLWEHCFTHSTSPIHNALIPYSGNYRVWGGLVPDFTLPAARKIFLDHHEEVVFSKGISGVKLDECDFQPYRSNMWSFPEATSFPSGIDGEQMHSLLGTLYQQTMLEPYNKKNLRTWGLVRSSHALAAPLPYVIYSDAYDHRAYVRGLAKAGFCGVLWTPEVRSADNIEDFIRRTQTVIFSPFAQIDSWFLRLPPWVQVDRAKNNAGEAMPEAAQVTKMSRRLFELRMSLIPYLYTVFNEYHRFGTPPMRAMVVDFPDDRQTQLLDSQFMCGSSLLVAPMFKGETARSVYLPAGDWYDFWTGEKYTGGRTIGVAKPLEQIPVFVKGETLLPLARPSERFTADTTYELEVRVYGENPVPFVLYEDDGETNNFTKGEQNQVTLSWDGTSISEKREGKYNGPPRYKVVSGARVGETEK